MKVCIIYDNRPILSRSFDIFVPFVVLGIVDDEDEKIATALGSMIKELNLEPMLENIAENFLIPQKSKESHFNLDEMKRELELHLKQYTSKDSRSFSPYKRNVIDKHSNVTFSEFTFYFKIHSIDKDIFNSMRRLFCDHFVGNCCSNLTLDRIINRECTRILWQDFEFLSNIIDCMTLNKEMPYIKSLIHGQQVKMSNMSPLTRKTLLKKSAKIMYNLTNYNTRDLNDLALYYVEDDSQLCDEYYDILNLDMYMHILPISNWISSFNNDKSKDFEYVHFLNTLHLARRGLTKTVTEDLYKRYYKLNYQIDMDCYKGDYVEMCLYNRNVDETMYELLCRSCAFNNVYFVPDFIDINFINVNNHIPSFDSVVRDYVDYYVLWQAFDLMPTAAKYDNCCRKTKRSLRARKFKNLKASKKIKQEDQLQVNDRLEQDNRPTEETSPLLLNVEAKRMNGLENNVELEESNRLATNVEEDVWDCRQLCAKFKAERMNGLKTNVEGKESNRLPTNTEEYECNRLQLNVEAGRSDEIKTNVEAEENYRLLTHVEEDERLQTNVETKITDALQINVEPEKNNVLELNDEIERSTKLEKDAEEENGDQLQSNVEVKKSNRLHTETERINKLELNVESDITYPYERNNRLPVNGKTEKIDVEKFDLKESNEHQYLETDIVVEKRQIINKKKKKKVKREIVKLSESFNNICLNDDHKEVDEWRQCAQYVLELLSKGKESNPVDRKETNQNLPFDLFNWNTWHNISRVKNYFIGIGGVILVIVSIIFELVILIHIM